MEYSHCDKNEKHISLHDCKAERAYFENGILGFDFNDGFWIGAEHPESHLSQAVKTDHSKVEYVLEYGDEFDVIVFVFKSMSPEKAMREVWQLQKLVDNINSGKCKLEFGYQYIDESQRIVEGHLWLEKKPYHMEFMMKICTREVNYYWNNLSEDRVW